MGSAVTDDDKIKQQIYHDAKFLLESAEKLNVSSEDIEGLRGVVNRFEIKSETIQDDLSGNNIVKVEDDL